MHARLAIATCGVVSAILSGGCSQGITYAPRQDHNSLAEPEFVHYVAQQPMVTYDELCRATLLVMDGEDFAGGFEERVSTLKSRGIVRPEWEYEADAVVDRGMLAYMIFKASGLSGGVNSWLAGWTGLACERYALKDVIRQGIMPYGLQYQVPTGGQVMAALAKADDYMATHGMYPSTERVIASPKDIE